MAEAITLLATGGSGGDFRRRRGAIPSGARGIRAATP